MLALALALALGCAALNSWRSGELLTTLLLGIVAGANALPLLLAISGLVSRGLAVNALLPIAAPLAGLLLAAAASRRLWA